MNPDNVPTYIEELQTFSAIHSVPAGQPGDLFALSSVLAANDRFRSEFGSMVRSFRYREHEGINFPEILALITAAWGGPNIVVIPGLPPPWRAELSIVLREILNRPSGEPPPIFEDEASEPAAEAVAAPVADATPTVTSAPVQENPIYATPYATAYAAASATESIPAKLPSPDLTPHAPGTDFAAVLSRLKARDSDSLTHTGESSPLVASEPAATLPPDPWAEGSWLHQQLTAFESTHPRQPFTRP